MRLKQVQEPPLQRASSPEALPRPPAARRLPFLAALLGVLLCAAAWSNSASLLSWHYSRQGLEALLASQRRRPEDRLLARVTADRLLAGGRASEAREVVLPLARNHPDDIELTVLAARALWQSGDPDQAGPFFDRAIRAAPTDPRVRYWTADFLYHRGYAEAAEELLREVTRLDPRHGDAWLRLGQIVLQDEHYAEALGLLDRAERQKPTAEVARARARALKNLGRLPEAEAAARAAVARAPTAESYAELGELLQFVAGEANLREAQACFKRSLDLDPGAVQTLKLLALNHRALGEHREAVRVLRRLLRRAPALSEGYLLLGQSYQALADPARARRCLGIYAALEPLETRVSRALYVAGANRGSIPLQIRLARAYLEAGRQDLACETLERARLKAPDNPEIAALLRRAQAPPTLRIEPLPADPTNDPP